MSDGYPLGADCDTDAIRECYFNFDGPLAAPWVQWTTDDGPIITSEWSSSRSAGRSAVWIGGKTPEYLPSSPQCRGDGATEPGGGAPTSKETQ